MCRLLETIRFENGEFSNLRFHQQRMNASQIDLFGSEEAISVREKIVQSQTFRELKHKKGLFKCRVIYAEQIEKIEFTHYQVPKIQSLQIVNDNDIQYAHKYLDRNHLEKLFSLKENCDDILIVKKGMITDTSFANLLFYNGKEWLTPAQPLLKGIQRQFLLDREQIAAADIRFSDLKYFTKARLVNAMIRFEDELDISTKSIFY